MKFSRGRRAAIAAIVSCSFVAAIGLLAKAPQAPSTAGSFLGKWEGTLGQGTAQLHLQLEIYELPNGATAGNLAVAEQGTSLDINTITAAGKSVKLEIHRIGGVYQGTLSDDGNEIDGTWTQTAATTPQPLNFRRAGMKAAEPPKPAPEAPTPKQFTAPLDIVAPISPTAFAADGKLHLVYELHISNFGRYDCSITKIDALGDDEKSAGLAQYSGAELEAVLTRPGLQNATPKAKISPGGTAVAFVWITLTGAATPPGVLRHRVTLTIGNNPDAMTIVTPALTVNRRGALLIGAPLKGDDWLAANGPSNTSQHRRAMIPVNGRAYISQRFAIDWVRLNPDGKTYKDDPLDNKNYRAYGEEALAVADATVTETKDGIPENTPGADSRAAPMTLENIAGNHVILNLGGGIYAMYAHLQPGSLKVHEGDKVRRGQALGLVGNSGNSTEPHLHFDLCDGNATLACEGLPYALQSFSVLGNGWGWKSSESHDPAMLHQREIPLENQVVTFIEAPEHHLLPRH
ncbi:MAG TPA: M23 family metallopeptidase [Candidatus Acidoferrales bacterium]|nr:M23 family metallopeptidase [Candidatus Acidoferrales bacterium]